MHVPGWENVPLREIMERNIGVPVVVDNDANVAALGEFVYGAGQGSQNMVYYTLSTGIGGGLILNGRLYRGSRGRAGEVGHIHSEIRHGLPCPCGNTGCLEAYCSGDSIAHRASVSHAADVFSQIDTDTRCRSIIDDILYRLGASMAGICNLLDPNCVVVGGAVAVKNPEFIERLRTVMKTYLLYADKNPPQILTAVLGDNSVLLGAAALTSEI